MKRERRFLCFGLGPQETSLRGVGLLAVLYLGAVLFAAVVAPLVWWGMQAWAQGAPNALNTYLAEKDFPRYFDRLRWLPVVLGLPWLLRATGLWSLRALGYDHLRPARFAAWFGLGVATLTAVALVQALSVGVSARDRSAFAVLETLALGLLSALAVSLLEETVFRGLVLRLFYTAFRPVLAVVLTSLFFASAHFKDVPDAVWTDGDPVTWASGFVVAFWTLWSPVATFELWPFVNLFLVGTILAVVFLRTGSLWVPIALHTGWVSVRFVYTGHFRTMAETPGFPGTQGMLDGGLAALALAGVFALVWRMPRRESAP